MSTVRLRMAAAAVAAVTSVVGPGVVAVAEDDKAHLVHEVTVATPSNGGVIQLDSISGFSEDGGVATIEPGTSAEEIFTYSATDAAVNELLGVTRENPADHPEGAVVEPRADTASSPTQAPEEAEPTQEPEEGEPTPSPSPSDAPGSPSQSNTGVNQDGEERRDSSSEAQCAPEIIEDECVPYEGDELCPVSGLLCQVPPPLPCSDLSCLPSLVCPECVPPAPCSDLSCLPPLLCPSCLPPVPGPETVAGIDASDESLADYVMDVITSVAGAKPLALPPVVDASGGEWSTPTRVVVDGEVCWGQSQRPHESRHNPGSVAAVGRTYCPSPKPFMKVKSVLKLLYGGHLRDVDSGSSTGQYRNRDGWWEVRVRLLYDCPSWDATFAIVSDHWVTFQSGYTAWAETSNHNKETISCGGLAEETAAKPPVP